MTDAANDPAPDTTHTSDEEHVGNVVENINQAAAAFQAAGNSGASWFYWIAGLSLVNTAILHSGGDRHFIVGLAITVIVDVIAAGIGKDHPDAATTLMLFAIGFSVFVSVIVAVFGWLSRKRFLWIFGIGMFLYVLDGLLYLVIGDFLSAAFHGYALFSMIQGFNGYRKLNQLEAAIAEATEGHAATETESDHT